MDRETRRAELRKHGGPSHKQEDHGNWASGRSKTPSKGGLHGNWLSRAKSKITIPGRSLQREIYPNKTGGKPSQKTPDKSAVRSLNSYVHNLSGDEKMYARGYLGVITGRGDIGRVRQRAADKGVSEKAMKSIDMEIDRRARSLTDRRRKG